MFETPINVATTFWKRLETVFDHATWILGGLFVLAALFKPDQVAGMHPAWQLWVGLMLYTTGKISGSWRRKYQRTKQELEQLEKTAK